MKPESLRIGGPVPVVPGRFVLKDEARKARHRLYPSTVLYPLHFAVIATIAWRTGHHFETAGFAVLGLAAWTFVEYLVHRHILHGRFPDGPGFKGFLHKHFDHLHIEHHARPWDGNHISGTLKDTLVPALGFMAIG